MNRPYDPYRSDRLPWYPLLRWRGKYSLPSWRYSEPPRLWPSRYKRQLRIPGRT
jgi:hypothetical protein